MFQEIININDSIAWDDVISYVTRDGKGGLEQQQSDYPVIRNLSRSELTDIMRDSSLSRRLFPGDGILIGPEYLVPTVENCNEHVLFEGKLYFLLRK